MKNAVQIVLSLLCLIAGGLSGCTETSPSPGVSSEADQDVRFIGAEKIVSGSVPSIKIEGLSPRQSVQLILVRMFERWEPNAQGEWAPVPVPMISWADMTANANGGIDVSQYPVMRGSWTGRDPFAIFWSGRRVSDAPPAPPCFDVMSMQPGENQLFLVRKNRIIGRHKLAFVEPEALQIKLVSEGRLNGVFAAPNDGRKYPSLILLHGSEGGGRDEAKRLAMRFANQGYAVFALNYFAWDMKNIPDIPNIHVNQPIELIAEVRDWMSTQEAADVSRLGLYGHSKGAEYAEVTAVRYDWVKAVAACVPTDIVWEGYGIGDERAKQSPDYQPPEFVSSWSWQGAPLPYVKLRPHVQGPDSPYFDNTDRYEMSRKDNPSAAELAAIPVETSKADFLLIGSKRDAVWASGAMAERLAERMRTSGRSSDVELIVFEKAGHQICGDGTYPTHLWSVPSDDPRVKDLDAEGRAAAESWLAIIDFFDRKLSGD